MYKIGVDIGGTTVKLGLIDDTMQIVQRDVIPFPHTTAGDAAEKIAQAAMGLLEKQGIGMTETESLGVVVPGSISKDGSMVLDAHNLGFHDVPLKAMLAQQIPELPVRLANDADGAAVAELYAGAFRGRETAVLLTLGTGLGGGIIMDGRLYRGGMRQGVELGHVILVAGGERCTCGNLGCAEAYCSATALAREGRMAMLAKPDSLLFRKAAGNPDAVDAKLVTDCAKSGDKVAIEVFERYTEHLSAVCASLFNLLDPEVVAIGGGLCAAGEFLFEPLRRKTDEKCFYRSHGEIISAQLGNDAGMIGAAMLYRNLKKQDSPQENRRYEYG